MNQYLIFQLNGQKFALPVDIIERVVRVVAVRPLAQSCPHVVGVIDLQGTVVSVINFRTLLGLPTKEIELPDMLLICRLNGTQFALLIDSIENTEYCEEQQSENTPMVPLPEALNQLVQFQGDLIPVYDVEKVFSQTGIQLTTPEAHNEAQSTS